MNPLNSYIEAFYKNLEKMSVIRPFDPWRSPLCTCPPKYSLSPYTGCGHRCKYCYITSYIRQPFSPRPKKDFIRRLIRDLRRIDYEKYVSMSNSSDPYTPPEMKLGLTRKTLEMLIKYNVRVLIVTKSTLVARDIDILRRGNVSVSITITSLDNKLASKLEPHAPLPNERLKVLGSLIESGVPCSVRIDPIIPCINDNLSELRRLIKMLAGIGVKHIVSSTYKARPDSFKRVINTFPDISKKLRELYFEEGEVIQRYRYLPRNVRYNILKGIAEIVTEEGMSFAVCREGFKELNTGATCDGSHLIPKREIRQCQVKLIN